MTTAEVVRTINSIVATPIVVIAGGIQYVVLTLLFVAFITRVLKRSYMSSTE